MTAVHPAPSLKVRVLEEEDRGAIAGLLDRDRVGTLYLRSLVHEHGVAFTSRLEHGRFLGSFRNGELTGMLFLGNARNITTWGDEPSVRAVLDRAAAEPRLPRLFIGPAAHGDLVRRTLNRGGISPFLDREQGYLVLTRDALAHVPSLPIRPGTPDDLDDVARAHAAMTEEDLNIPSASLDRRRLRRAALARLSAGKIWVAMEGNRLACKMEESARSEDGVLVGGVYTSPEFRNRGYATRTLAAWARILFDEGLLMLTLHVNMVNFPAVRAYEKVGFKRHSTLRLMLAY